jgi:uncharacterized protein YbaP (TraB family)
MLERVGFRGSPRDRRMPSRGRPKRRLAALAALFLAAPCFATPALPVASPRAVERQPALWVVSDRDTTIYLFGTFHALDASTDWFAPRIRAAFGQADQLVLETVIPTDPGEMFATLKKYGLTREPVVGQPVVAASHSPTFVSAAGQAVASGKSMGMTVESGADAVLRRAAERSGKPVAALETFDFQIGMFTALSALPVAPGAAGAPVPAVGDMRSSWKAGDAGRITAMLGSIERQSPAAYRMLFTDRNARWAGWIANRLEQPGTAFVAVGAGHLIGRDSVQAQLAVRGIRSTRVS